MNRSVKACAGVLAGERSHSCTPDRRKVLLYQGRLSFRRDTGGAVRKDQDTCLAHHTADSTLAIRGWHVAARSPSHPVNEWMNTRMLWVGSQPSACARSWVKLISRWPRITSRGCFLCPLACFTYRSLPSPFLPSHLATFPSAGPQLSGRSLLWASTGGSRHRVCIRLLQALDIRPAWAQDEESFWADNIKNADALDRKPQEMVLSSVSSVLLGFSCTEITGWRQGQAGPPEGLYCLYLPRGKRARRAGPPAWRQKWARGASPAGALAVFAAEKARQCRASGSGAWAAEYCQGSSRCLGPGPGWFRAGGYCLVCELGKGGVQSTGSRAGEGNSFDHWLGPVINGCQADKDGI